MILSNRDSAALLGRPSREDLVVSSASELRGARVLVTGAGGSIGAHLGQALAGASMDSLTLLDHHEHSLFDLVKGLGDAVPKPSFVLADVRDTPKMERVFELARPTHVFHLAAYKHVPFGELFPEETVSVNINATRALLDLSADSGVERFIYPSSDKAVNPPSLYGATKRLSEVATQQRALASGLRYTVVRYVNVLGTRGSVIETFAQQLARGESLTITSAEMTRYWMTMPEAVWLLLAAATRADPGDIHMIQPLEEISVVDMARKLGQALGYPAAPAIRYTGIRPGERLREELLSQHESFAPSQVEGIALIRHRDRVTQLGSALPSFNDAAHAQPDELTRRVMELARQLQ